MGYAQVLVDFTSIPVLSQQPSENSLSSHPQNLGGHPGFGSTLAFTGTSVSSLSLRSEEIAGTAAGVDGGWFDDDSSVLDELFNMGAGVGIANFSLLGGVQPDFALANASDGGGKTFLRSEVDWMEILERNVWIDEANDGPIMSVVYTRCEYVDKQ